MRRVLRKKKEIKLGLIDRNTKDCVQKDIRKLANEKSTIKMFLL